MHAVLEHLVREQRARLVGALARWCGDLQLAEDGFSDAVERALAAWGSEMPRDPLSWVITAARNRIRDIQRSGENTRTRALDPDDPEPHAAAPAARDDDTLALMFACVHPSLDRGVHAPLILHVVIGVETIDIATAFALPVATLSKRLVRAKQKLRANRTSFEVPESIDSDRVSAVLDAIYAAYSTEWLRVAPTDSAELVVEHAIHASQLLFAALPTDREVRGLAALLLYLHSRRNARIVDGHLIPTERQDVARWDPTLIAHAEKLLRKGLSKRSAAPGAFELQAAIQSAHAARATTGVVEWEIVARLYDALILVTPSKGARVARAVAIARATDSATGLRILTELAAHDLTLEHFQPYFAARASLLFDIGEQDAGLVALERAIDLCTHPPSRRYLESARPAGRQYSGATAPQRIAPTPDPRHS